jgi:GntR family transcriptional repressor for pyruvate dehydrogenase complex
MARIQTKAPSAVKIAAQELRKLAMASEDGTFLGSEDDLVTQLKISRPTLRQAAAQVAEEHLVTIKRGVGGGYFSSSPNSMTVARMAALYLQTHGAKLEEIIRAVEPIRAEIAHLATRNISGETKADLEKFIERERAIEQEDVSYRVFLRTEREFGKLLGAASGNRVLTLFLGILYDFAALIGSDEDVYVNRPDRVAQYRSYRNRMALAILDGDEEMAVLATRRCSAVVTDWMMEDLPADGFGDVRLDHLDSFRPHRTD